MTDAPTSRPTARGEGARRALLDRLLMAKGDRGDIPRLPPGVNEAPLTAAQARLWFLNRLFPQSAEYNGYATLKLDTSPGETGFRGAVLELMERHDALRLEVIDASGAPRQRRRDGLAAPVRWSDLSGLAPEEAQARARALGETAAREPFDPTRAPLFRVAACKMPDGSLLATCVFHHIVVDGASLGILFEELNALASGHALKAGPDLGFLDYAAWRAAQEAAGGFDAQLDYWREALGGDLPELVLPKDRPRPVRPTRTGGAAPIALAADLLTGLDALGDAEQATRYAVLLAAYKALLHRLTGQEDLIVGAPFAGRTHPAIEHVAGMFVNTAALRDTVRGRDTPRALVRRVRDTLLAAHDNAEAPFDAVVAALKAPRDISYSPVFQTMFGLTPAAGAGLGPGAQALDLKLDSGAAKWDLTVSLEDFGAHVDGFLEYDKDLFDPSTADRFAAMYVRLCRAFVDGPDAPISSLPLMDGAEREQILHGLNSYRRPELLWRNLAEPFQAQVARTPDATALIAETGPVTYAELNSRANRLAHHLSARGVGPGDRVAVCMERSPELIAALYATAKLGAAYAPLDPELPDARLAYMLEDIAPAALLVHAPTRERALEHALRLDLDADAHQWAQAPDFDPPPYGAPGGAAYILYTSGSTGRPKGVVHPVDAAIAEIEWLHARYPMQLGDANIFKTSFGFDVSIWEIFWTLYYGATLVIPKAGGHRDPQHLVELVERHGVTFLFLIPGMLELFLQAMTPGGCASLRWILCGGAPTPPRLRDMHHERCTAVLINGFGPTEAGCVTDMILPREPGAPVPLGRPAANYRVYVLDGELEPQPIGVPGEMYLAGEVGLSHGYLDRPGLTAERYLPDPHGEPGGRMYRTGDLGRLRADGVLEHLGRIGRQVKVRGMRIEPAEIEAVLCEHPDIARAVVAPAEDEALGLQLPAFVVPDEGRSIDPEAVLAHARRMLPGHMAPAAVIAIEAVPFNVNGKVDEPALVALWRDAPRPERIITPPETDDEAAMTQIFAELLGLEEVGVDETFFALGGHSLLIFKLLGACEARFGVAPSVIDVFTEPSPRGLCRLLAEGGSQGSNLAPLAPVAGAPLLVFVHAASGSALPFMETARAMGEGVSCYGLESPGDVDPADPIPVEALADRYVEAVDAVRELRPVILAGWSMGGCIALEMARRWMERGVDVAGLIMLDTWTPPPALEADGEAQTARAVIEALELRGLEVNDDMDGLEDPGMIARLEQVFDANRAAFMAYRPRPIDIEIDYLRAEDPPPEVGPPYPSAYDAPDRGWSRIAAHTQARTTPGGHSTMLSRENAGDLAQTLKSIIEQRLAYGDI